MKQPATRPEAPGRPLLMPSRPAAPALAARPWAAGGARVTGRLPPMNPRWLLAFALLAIMALALAGLPSSPPLGRSLPADDEVLAYHVEQDQDLAIKIPIEIDAVEVTTWIAVKVDACDATKRYPYGFAVAFLDERAQEVARHDYDLESRISCDPRSPLGEGEYAARLERGEGAVTDPRSTLVITRDVLPRGGTLRIRAKPAAGDDGARPEAQASARGSGSPDGALRPEAQVLARVEGRYRRSETTRAIFEQSLDAEERQRIARRLSALGFADLPEQARTALLTGWERRLEAAGREGTDYRLSRLLLRNFRTPFPRAEGRGAAEFVIGERHAAALNFRGPVSLDIEGPVGRVVRVADGTSPVALADLGAAGKATVLLAREDIRTAVIDGVGPDFGVRFAVPEAQASMQIGEIVHPAMPPPPGMPAAAAANLPARLQTPPDVRIVRYLKLDPSDPVVARIAPGQELLGLLIRTEIEVSGGVDRGEATVVARWGKGAGQSADIRVPLLRSRFEWWTEGGDASDPQLVILRLPPGVERVEITGDPKTRVRVRTIEPGVAETLYRLPYRVLLKEDEVWRYAPFDVSTWTDVRAVNLDELERNERFSDLREQVRIERPGEGGKSDADLPERVLLPENAPVRRRLLLSAWQSAGEPYPGDALTPLMLAKNVRVDAEGARAGQLSVLYRAERGRIGKQVVLRVDGDVVAEAPVVALSGALRAAVPAGVHHVAVEGLGDAGAAYADAPPENGGAIMRRRDIFELTRARPMLFRFTQKPGETLHLVLFVVTPEQTAPFRLRYSLTGAKPASREAVFFRRVTLPEGELTGRGGDVGMGTIWEAPTEKRGIDGVGRTVIRIGDDLAPGDRLVRIDLQASTEERLAEQVWVGAVLVGQRPPASANEPRIWVEDDL